MQLVDVWNWHHCFLSRVRLLRLTLRSEAGLRGKVDVEAQAASRKCRGSADDQLRFWSQSNLFGSRPFNRYMETLANLHRNTQNDMVKFPWFAHINERNMHNTSQTKQSTDAEQAFFYTRHFLR